YGKFVGLAFEFVRFRWRWDSVMGVGLAVCLLLCTGRVKLRDLRDSTVVEMTLLAATFIAIYVILPMGYSEAWYVDVRALALASLFVILACANLPITSVWARVSGPALATTLATALVAANLFYLEHHLARGQEWLAQY